MPPPKKTTERSESQVSKGEGRRLATKGTKSTKGRPRSVVLPFVLFVPFVANLLPSPLDKSPRLQFISAERCPKTEHPAGGNLSYLVD